MKGHEREIEAVALGTNSKQLVSVGQDGTLTISKNSPNPHVIKNQLAKQNKPIDFFALKLNTGGLSNSYSGQLNSKDLIHGHITLESPTGSLRSALSSEAGFLASASTVQTLILWDQSLALKLNWLIEHGCGRTTNYLTNDEPETNSEAILPSDHREVINKGRLQNRTLRPINGDFVAVCLCAMQTSSDILALASANARTIML